MTLHNSQMKRARPPLWENKMLNKIAPTTLRYPSATAYKFWSLMMNPTTTRCLPKYSPICNSPLKVPTMGKKHFKKSNKDFTKISAAPNTD